MNALALKQLLLLQQLVINLLQTTIIIMNRGIYKKLLKKIFFAQNDRVLDLACGDGLAINYLAKKYKKMHIDGIAMFEETYIKAYRKNKKYINNGKINILFGNIDKLEIKGSYDKIFGINALYLWPNPQDGLKKAIKLLNDEGELILFLTPINEIHKFMNNASPHDRYPIKEIISDLKKEGINNIELKRCKTKFGNGVILLASKIK